MVHGKSLKQKRLETKFPIKKVILIIHVFVIVLGALRHIKVSTILSSFMMQHMAGVLAYMTSEVFPHHKYILISYRWWHTQNQLSTGMGAHVCRICRLSASTDKRATYYIIHYFHPGSQKKYNFQIILLKNLSFVAQTFLCTLGDRCEYF